MDNVKDDLIRLNRTRRPSRKITEVTPTQADRDAAAELYRILQNGDVIPTSLHDKTTHAEQARREGLSAGLEQAAVIAEGYPSPMNDLPMVLAMRSVAQAIRAAKEQ
jgi:hypothetical protein